MSPETDGKPRYTPAMIGARRDEGGGRREGPCRQPMGSLSVEVPTC